MNWDARSRLGILNLKSLTMEYTIYAYDLARKPRCVKLTRNKVDVKALPKGESAKLEHSDALKVIMILYRLGIDYRIV